MNLMLEPLRKFADFEGRARRAEYWLFTLFVLIAYVVAMLIGGLFDRGGSPEATPEAIFFCLTVLALFVPSLALVVRRLHDINRSGWWYLLAFLPVIGSIIILIFMLTPGTPGPNRYGPDPKTLLAETFA